MNLKSLLLLGIAMLSFFQATTQIITTFPKENPRLKKYILPENQPAISRESNQLDLPFFDDFSYEGDFPISTHWEDRFVFINNTWANAPVSVGFATFDGLDATGTPYGGSFGSSDTLTSVPLNLGGLSSAYMSYYIQPKGLGDAPEPGSDLILEFKNAEGEWLEIERHIQSLSFFPRDSVTEFAYIDSIEIDNTDFLYDGFQFRFRNFSTRNGAVDLWHLDYVRLEANPISQELRDLAFTELPPSILTTYSSAPWTHYISPTSQLAFEETRNNFKVNLFNHTSANFGVNESTLGTFNVTTGAENELFELNDLIANPPIMPNRQELDFGISFNFSTLIAPLQEVPFIRDNNLVFIRTAYEMLPDTQADIPEVTRNDRVSSITELNDFYAYDDGSAETAIQISGLGGQAAMEFFNYEADSLRGFLIQIPRLAVGENGTITIQVWLDDLNTEPIAELPISPFFLDEVRDTLQAFVTYALRDEITGVPTPVEIPVGVFYVGWEQGLCRGANCVAVGLDRNTPEAAEFMFLNEDGNWRQVSENLALYGEELLGALMIRPILGNKTPVDSDIPTSINELPVQELMQISPNPTDNEVAIQLFEGNYEAYRMQIFNSLGQVMDSHLLQPTIRLEQYPPGIYFLQFIHEASQKVGLYKLVVE